MTAVRQRDFVELYFSKVIKRGRKLKTVEDAYAAAAPTSTPRTRRSWITRPIRTGAPWTSAPPPRTACSTRWTSPTPTTTAASTKEMVVLIRRKFPNSTIYFDDPALFNKGLTTSKKKHHNHLHWIIR